MPHVSGENKTQLDEAGHDICQFIFGSDLLACHKFASGHLPHFNLHLHLHLRHEQHFLIIFITKFTYFKCSLRMTHKEQYEMQICKNAEMRMTKVLKMQMNNLNDLGSPGGHDSHLSLRRCSNALQRCSLRNIQKYK